MRLNWPMCDCSLQINEELLVTIPRDGITVCSGCGFVVDYLVTPELPFMVTRNPSTYRRVFHNNERLALITQTGPPVPDAAYALIEEEHFQGCVLGKYPPAWDLTSRDISKICGSVVLDKYMQRKFRSRKNKLQVPTNLKKFAERWIEIKSRLVGESIVNVDPECVIQLRRYFVCLQVPFDTLIHNQVICGKLRKNFINYNLVYTCGLEMLGYDYYKEFFPLPKEEKLKDLCDLIWILFRYLQWPPTSTILAYSSLVDRSVPPGYLTFAESDKGYTPRLYH